MQMQNTRKDFNRWLYFVSPCVIVAAFSLFAILDYFLKAGAWGSGTYIGVMIFSSALLIVTAIDFLVKRALRQKLAAMWIAEIILLVIIFLVYRSYVRL